MYIQSEANHCLGFTVIIIDEQCTYIICILSTNSEQTQSKSTFVCCLLQICLVQTFLLYLLPVAIAVEYCHQIKKIHRKYCVVYYC